MSLVSFSPDFERKLIEHGMFPRDFFPGWSDPWRLWSPWRGWHAWDPLGAWGTPTPWEPWHEALREVERGVARTGQLMAGSLPASASLVPLTTALSDEDEFRLDVDVRGFAPEEVEVKVKDGEVVVRCAHQERWDGETRQGRVARALERRVTLPAGALPDTVRCELSVDGVLRVRAPRVLALPARGERVVPVLRTGPVPMIR